MGFIPAAGSGDFVVLNASQFRVLAPEVGLHLFQGVQESENCDIAFCDGRPVILLIEGKCPAVQQQTCARGCCARR